MHQGLKYIFYKFELITQKIFYYKRESLMNESEVEFREKLVVSTKLT